MEERKVVDFYRDTAFLFRLGQVGYLNVHAPLAEHTHGKMLEIVFMIRGAQVYYVENKKYNVQGGNIFIVYPGERHGTGSMPEDKASFYYLIVDPDNLNTAGYGLMNGETEGLLSALKKNVGRIRKGSAYYTGCCAELLELCESDTSMKNTRIRNCLSGLLIDLALGKPESQAETGSRIDIVCAYIENNLKEDIPIDSLAKMLNVSVSWFKKCFTDTLGLPPGEYILRRRIARCRKELEITSKSITEVAFEYGFSSSQYFSTVFKKYCGITPSDFRAGLPAVKAVINGLEQD